jgi:DNA-binding MarR family transcriptional regulator
MAAAAQALGSHELKALATLGLTLRSYGVLALAAAEELGQNEIGELTGIDRTTVVAVVDDLEAAGLVVRTPCPSDRRIRLVQPTAEGRALAGRAVAAVRAVEDEFTAVLAPGQREALAQAVAALRAGPLGTPADLGDVPGRPRRRPGRGQPG